MNQEAAEEIANRLREANKEKEVEKNAKFQGIKTT
jgi:hypothetical protein